MASAKLSFTGHVGVFLALFIITFSSCQRTKRQSSAHAENWKSRTVTQALPDSLLQGQTYLSVYAEIYSQTEHLTHKLTATVSMRNINMADTIYINKAVYYNTQGQVVRSYFEKTIFIAPMQTVEIVIDETDVEGGTGANFLFDWQAPAGAQEPYFEGVMISTSGQQGLSFTTQGKRVD
jgi:hypothetical protein